ncbi:MAG: helix-turn-helix domain-containing protein [bacterium]
MQNNHQKTHISVAELAKMLGISRIAVFKRIKKGQIPAERIGRSYVISINDVNEITQGIGPKILTKEKKEVIEKAVKKTVKEYGETLKLLGKE